MESKGKQRSMIKEEEYGESEWPEEDNEGFEEKGDESDQTGIKKKRALTGKKASSGGNSRCCQAENCSVDLSESKTYHRRHKVCEVHAKAQVVAVGGIRQRFCQQCSRFHKLAEFDDTKRSCRRRLAGHNERRRKNMAESHPGGSARNGVAPDLNDMICGQVDDRGRIKITIRDHSSYKHFQIR